MEATLSSYKPIVINTDNGHNPFWKILGFIITLAIVISFFSSMVKNCKRETNNDPIVINNYSEQLDSINNHYNGIIDSIEAAYNLMITDIQEEHYRLTKRNQINYESKLDSIINLPADGTIEFFSGYVCREDGSN